MQQTIQIQTAEEAVSSEQELFLLQVYEKLDHAEKQIQEEQVLSAWDSLDTLQKNRL